MARGLTYLYFLTATLSSTSVTSRHALANNGQLERNKRIIPQLAASERGVEFN